MSNFEKASRLKLRFQTPKGYVSTEDLWDMSLQSLNTVAKDLNKKVKESSEVDFLEEKSVEDDLTKLQFDVVIHVMDVKKHEQKAKLEAATKKAEREKIMGVLAKKQDDALENLTEEELKQKLVALSS